MTGEDAMVKRLIARFGKLIAASFGVMAIGVLVFLLSLPLYAAFGIDTDIIGLVIFTTGLAICLIGVARRKTLRGWKMGLLAALAAVLLLPTLSLVVSLVYFLVTGKELGS